VPAGVDEEFDYWMSKRPCMKDNVRWIWEHGPGKPFTAWKGVRHQKTLPGCYGATPGNVWEPYVANAAPKRKQEQPGQPRATKRRRASAPAPKKKGTKKRTKAQADVPPDNPAEPKKRKRAPPSRPSNTQSYSREATPPVPHGRKRGKRVSKSDRVNLDQQLTSEESEEKEEEEESGDEERPLPAGVNRSPLNSRMKKMGNSFVYVWEETVAPGIAKDSLLEHISGPTLMRCSEKLRVLLRKPNFDEKWLAQRKAKLGHFKNLNSAQKRSLADKANGLKDVFDVNMSTLAEPRAPMYKHQVFLDLTRPAIVVPWDHGVACAGRGWLRVLVTHLWWRRWRRKMWRRSCGTRRCRRIFRGISS